MILVELLKGSDDLIVCPNIGSFSAYRFVGDFFLARPITDIFVLLCVRAKL